MSHKDEIKQSIADLESKVSELKELLAQEEKKPDIWRPKGGDWFVGSGGDIYKLPGNTAEVLAGSYYPSEQAAKIAKMYKDDLNLRLNYLFDHAPDYVHKSGEEAWHVSFSNPENRAFIIPFNMITDHGPVMPGHVAKQLAADMNSGRVQHNNGYLTIPEV